MDQFTPSSRVLSPREILDGDTKDARRADVQRTLLEWTEDAIAIIRGGTSAVRFDSECAARGQAIDKLFMDKYVEWCNEVVLGTTTSELMFEYMCYIFVIKQGLSVDIDISNAVELLDEVQKQTKLVTMMLYDSTGASQARRRDAVMQNVAPLIVFVGGWDHGAFESSSPSSSSSSGEQMGAAEIDASVAMLCSRTARYIFWGRTVHRTLARCYLGFKPPALTTSVLKRTLFAQTTETSGLEDRFLVSFTHELQLAMGARENHMRTAFDAWGDISLEVLLKSDSAAGFSDAVSEAADESLGQMLGRGRPEEHLCYDTWLMLLWQRHMNTSARIDFLGNYFVYQHEIVERCERLHQVNDNLRTRRPLIVFLAARFWVQSVAPDALKTGLSHLMIKCNSLVHAFAVWSWVMSNWFGGKVETEYSIKELALDCLQVEEQHQQVDDSKE